MSQLAGARPIVGQGAAPLGLKTLKSGSGLQYGHINTFLKSWKKLTASHPGLRGVVCFQSAYSNAKTYAATANMPGQGPLVLLQLSEMVAGQGGHRLTPQLVESVAAGATMENLKFFATAMNFFVAEGLLGGELVKILMKSLAGCPGCTFETPLGERVRWRSGGVGSVFAAGCTNG